MFLADQGRFRLADDHPLAAIEGVQAALWGDLDNDGSPEVYFCKKGPNQLFRRTEDGGWEDITNVSATGAGNRNTVDGLWLDADHDGDLDLFLVNADGPNELLNNNRDGTFRPIAADQGLAGDGRPSRMVLATDLDKDRDVDLIVLKEAPPHEVYLNDRLWRYRARARFRQI